MDQPNVEGLIQDAIRHGWRISCEIPLSQFGDKAGLAADEFISYLAGIARDGLHIDYEASWGFFVRMPMESIRVDHMPGKITRGISHQANPRAIRLTFSRLAEPASVSRAA